MRPSVYSAWKPGDFATDNSDFAAFRVIAATTELLLMAARHSLDHIAPSGTPCASRRHAPGLTPTAAENTRVKWL